MRTPSLPGLAALAAALLTAPAAAQEASQPRLILSIGAGAHTGHGLWSVTGPPVVGVDSLRMSRSIGSGLMATFSATYFPGGHVGFYGDITFLDMEMDNNCTPAPYCGELDGSTSGNSSLLFGGGITLRAAPGGSQSPYARLGVGYARHAHGTVGVDAIFPGSPPVQLIADESPMGGSPALLLAAGLSQSIGTGYQLRLEVRDDFFALERVTSAPNALGQVTTDTGWYHHLSLTIGFDIVFDRTRARRY
ncbi:MAG TPA: hypothetical protein VD707_05035 [Gemmatimonadales bacterium]|nr:hypothetical protein [Gemmatimonadales bacterium]